jgi:mRNA interferase MazF
VLVVQGDAYNRSRLATTIVAVLTSNTALAAIPGNVFLPAVATGLPKDSVVNVTALATVDRHDLDPHSVGRVPAHLMAEVDQGVRQVLDLA